MDPIIRKIFAIETEGAFHDLSLEIFHYQASRNPVYRKYIELLGISADEVKNISQIPFLPVSLFKKYPVKSFQGEAEKVFVSSGTTATDPSKHHIFDPGLYEESFLRTFRMFYGNPEERVILALLPSYLERKDSSLIYMVDTLIRLSGSPHSGFYLYDLEKLHRKLNSLAGEKTPVLLIGVSFALLEFAEKYKVNVPGMIVMETGGMKGKRREMTRAAVHEKLTHSFQVSSIHSEYGMTELLSQAYSQGDGFFRTPPWMKILIRDPYDPLTLLPPGRHGGIDIIDLANLYSCSFLETGDLGMNHQDGSFSVSGRFDHSELRGCNLMVQDL